MSARNNNDVRKILSSFIQVVDGLNSLRNDKGDGHGKGQNYKELPVRYAKLAMNASLTIVHFTWDTYKMFIDR
ncbi:MULTISPECIES: abortive infection family protein [unclassified Oceanobacillus]|uniref:abortive infection family protein n=1 Tax=unclassified Oceanobacillus TaxID=2630292 RepID=UPI003FA5AEAC